MLEQNTDIIFPENRDKYRYWELEKFTKIFTIVAVIFGAAVLLVRKQIFLLVLANILIPLACVVLDILLPDYFTILYSKKEMLTNEQASRISLLNPFLISAGSLMVATKLNLHISSITALLIGGLVIAAIAFLLSNVFLAELRKAEGRKITALLLFLVLGLGVLGQGSYWLDQKQPEMVTAEVVAVRDNSNDHFITALRGAALNELIGNEYTCTIRMEDGKEIQFPVSSTSKVAIGAKVTVNKHEGIPGIVCYTLRSMKLNFIDDRIGK